MRLPAKKKSEPVTKSEQPAQSEQLAETTQPELAANAAGAIDLANAAGEVDVANAAGDVNANAAGEVDVANAAGANAAQDLEPADASDAVEPSLPAQTDVPGPNDMAFEPVANCLSSDSWDAATEAIPGDALPADAVADASPEALTAISPKVIQAMRDRLRAEFRFVDTLRADELDQP